MFSPSSNEKGFFAGKVLPLFFVLCFVMGAVLFSGCDLDGDDDTAGALIGTWTNVYDPGGENEYITTITITSSTVTYTGSYEGTIANSPDFDASAGVLIIKFTKYADYGSEPGTSHANVDKYGALYWDGLTASSVKLSDAGIFADGAYTHTMFDTLDAAKTAFTNNTADTYVDWLGVSSYTKTN